MRGLQVIALMAMGILAFCNTACATDEKHHAPAAAFVPLLNQKVEAYFLVKGIPSDFTFSDYKKALEEKCFPFPACRQQAEELFNRYEIVPRKIGDGFSVLYCDKGTKTKVMEDFSCNSTCVEVQTFKTSESTPCLHETDWQAIVDKKCARGASCDD